VSAPAEAERIARAALTWVAEPGDPIMGALLRICSPAEIVAADAARAAAFLRAAEPALKVESYFVDFEGVWVLRSELKDRAAR